MRAMGENPLRGTLSSVVRIIAAALPQLPPPSSGDRQQTRQAILYASDPALGKVEVPDQERQYCAGPPRKTGGRMAHKVTHLRDYATKFATVEDAQATLEELGDGYEIVTVEA
jgi:hypothetical protein